MLDLIIVLKSKHSLEACASKYALSHPLTHPFIQFLEEYGKVEEVINEVIACKLPNEWIAKTKEYHLVDHIYRKKEDVLEKHKNNSLLTKKLEQLNTENKTEIKKTSQGTIARTSYTNKPQQVGTQIDAVY